MTDLLRKSEQKDERVWVFADPQLLSACWNYLPLSFLLHEIIKCLYYLSHLHVVILLFAAEIIPDTNSFKIYPGIPQICY